MDDPIDMLEFGEAYVALGWAVREQLNDLFEGETSLDRYARAALSDWIIPFCERWFDGEGVADAQRLLKRMEEDRE